VNVLELLATQSEIATKTHLNPNGSEVLVPADAEIGDNVFIHPNASLGKGFKVGNGSKIGPGTEFGNKVSVGENSRIGHCKVGDDVKFGNGVLYIQPGTVVDSGATVPNNNFTTHPTYSR